ncbi:MAG: Gfo/Idh/MocA family oxidoreductase [Bacteroidetes bacterium]|jgi:UDP-N-acetyl-2-amino-2-deoxyglucuronate dehydrogenase|nr:Gfo/Idh/MocA family oxidoreductase [Bacteroidota bacterium]MBT4399663.1 Gfo/Idh/MocA family oxidoreductase [Bacteroidota bacterium]MBT4409550.1 Gfo/Idh/MocA family oxidoreductase [Bacteroidota bacterium]MBT5426002.1 Gfo/Idh/MocA family oxidoreductase [Bacteroidota bacterium]MBT7092704.1 Gfo/Idh/MocA family oxidoreductase [Bacteroidota bacterium]
MKQFAIIGAAGYIAPRHMRAIKETGNNLACALDKNDSVGVIDSFFPDAEYFIEYERFDRHLDRLLRNSDSPVDYISICTPNYLHDSEIRFALRSGANAICEKPLVLNPWNVDALEDFQKDYQGTISCIMQLRLHPSIMALKKQIQEAGPDRVYDIDLNYITSRGKWYFSSWKADLIKSGGVATNIGVHFFDMLTWIFGPIEENVVHMHNYNRAAGYLRLKQARVRWFLSVEYDDIPSEIKKNDQRTYRSLLMDGQELEFSDGFTDLHTRSYKEILEGNSFGVSSARKSIEAVYKIRSSYPIGMKGDYHPYIKKLGITDFRMPQGGPDFNKDC